MGNLRAEKYVGHQKEEKFMLEMQMELLLFGMLEIHINYVICNIIKVVLKAHDSDITKLQWLNAENTLLTASKDKKIKAWQLP